MKKSTAGLAQTVHALEARVRRPMAGGYIAMERISMLPIFRGVKGAVGEKIFRYLCERARFQPSAVEVYGANVHLLLQPGQLWTRTRQIEKDIGISKSTVAEWLRRLEAEGLIHLDVRPSTSSGVGFTVVTITSHLLSPTASAAPRPSAVDEGGSSGRADEIKTDLLNNLSKDIGGPGKGDPDPGSPDPGPRVPGGSPDPELPPIRPGETRLEWGRRVSGRGIFADIPADDSPRRTSSFSASNEGGKPANPFPRLRLATKGGAS